LIHVRRRDWVFQLVEEAVRTLLWFHPAIWWLIGRIQLSREQVVDQAAVAMIESRERYVEALLAVAIAKSPGMFTPAPAFLRRSL
jgi:beta-lactamase regulating signal transducer with metallopeptidase domain